MAVTPRIFYAGVGGIEPRGTRKDSLQKRRPGCDVESRHKSGTACHSPHSHYRQVAKARQHRNSGGVVRCEVTTPEAAARAYDVAALKFHGEFARLNFGDAA